MPARIKVRLIYFAIYSGLAVWLSYFNVHLEQIGFTGFQIGVINAIYVSSSIVVIPLGGFLSDKYGSHLVLFILSLISGILIFSLGYTSEFLLLSLLMFALSVFNQPVNALIDGIVLKQLKDSNRQSYGKYRLWGSFGFASGALVVGYLAQWESKSIFILSAILLWSGALFAGSDIKKSSLATKTLVTLSSLTVFYKNIVLRNVFLIILIFGIVVSPLHFFINLYFTSMGATQSQIGLAFAIQAFFEIPLFFIGIWYLKKAGPEKVIILAMMVSVLRMVLYGLTRDPSTAIYIGIFHGFTISFFLIGVVEFVQRQTPSHLRTTAQGLILSFHFGAGLAVGNIWIGFLKDQIGMHQVMMVQSLLSVFVILISILFFKKTRVVIKTDFPGTNISVKRK
jgi:MFS transporter, PPP family, 3-phenylpropionic acid transporter